MRKIFVVFTWVFVFLIAFCVHSFWTELAGFSWWQATGVTAIMFVIPCMTIGLTLLEGNNE